MKVLPIANNNYQKNVSYKGTISSNVTKTLNSYSEHYAKLLSYAKTRPEKYPTLISDWEYSFKYNSSYAEAVIKNLKTIMSRFGKSCVLDLHQSKKDPSKHLFVIESKDSSYKHICGEAVLANHIIANIDKFSKEKLAKINPYEINLKFMQMWQPKSLTDADIFEAEKDIWFIKDELVVAEPTIESEGRELTMNEIRDHYKKLKDEGDEFDKEFQNIIK